MGGAPTAAAAIPLIAAQRVRLTSRNGVDHARRFADRAAAVVKLSARTLVLDREVAIYDQQLRSRFDWPREPDPDAVALPPLLPTRLRERKVINCYFFR